MKKLLTTVLLTSIAAAGCKNTGLENNAAAGGQTGTQMAAEHPMPAAADGGFPPGTYDVDPGHSVFLFKIRHLGAGYTYGWFKDVTGTINVDRDATKQSIALTIKTASVDSRDPKRDDHMRSPDFFNVAQFPTITFKSTQVEPRPGNVLSVTGDLTIHGVTKPVTIPVAALGSGPDPMVHYMHVGYEAKLTIKRSDFDMKFMSELIGDDVELTIGIEAARAPDASKK